MESLRPMFDKSILNSLQASIGREKAYNLVGFLAKEIGPLKLEIGPLGTGH